MVYHYIDATAKWYFKDVIRKLKSKVYPHIRLKQRHNALYTPEQLLDTLAYAALTHDFTTNGAKCFKLVNGEAPHPNNLLSNKKA